MPLFDEKHISSWIYHVFFWKFAHDDTDLCNVLHLDWLFAPITGSGMVNWERLHGKQIKLQNIEKVTVGWFSHLRT